MILPALVSLAAAVALPAAVQANGGNPREGLFRNWEHVQALACGDGLKRAFLEQHYRRRLDIVYRRIDVEYGPQKREPLLSVGSCRIVDPNISPTMRRRARSHLDREYRVSLRRFVAVLRLWEARYRPGGSS